MGNSIMDFNRNYKASILEELPQPEQVLHFYFPGAKATGGADGVLVSIEPKSGRPWLGTFAFGDLNPKSITGLFSMPNPDRLCVVSRGRAYIVAAAEPRHVEDVLCFPVLDVRQVPEYGVIIFANHTEMFAYGSAGQRWRTKRLAWDSLRITGISDGVIRGEFWDIRSEKISEFSVDIDTGKHKGGADFGGG